MPVVLDGCTAITTTGCISYMKYHGVCIWATNVQRLRSLNQKSFPIRGEAMLGMVDEKGR